MMNSSATVFIVDDDDELRALLRRLLEAAELTVETFRSADEFLSVYETDRPGCLLLDLQLPGISGLELQQRLAERRSHLPIIFLTAHGEVGAAVTALHTGALDFLEKPVSGDMLLYRVRRAIQVDADQRLQRAREAEAEARLDRLTRREKEILPLLLEGLPSKTIAARLNISPKTVDIHRSNIMKKAQAESVVALAAMLAPVLGWELAKRQA